MATKYWFQSRGEPVRAFLITCRLLDIIKAHFLSRAQLGYYRDHESVTYALTQQRHLEVKAVFNAIRKYPALVSMKHDGCIVIQQILFERFCFHRDIIGYESVNDDVYAERDANR